MADRLAGPSTCASTVSAPFLSCVHLDPPSRAIRHPFHLKRKTCAPHHCRQHLYRPNMLLYLSFRPPFSYSLCGPFFYLFLRKIFTSFLVFFPPFFFFFLCSEGKERNTYSSHFAVPPSIIFSCGAAFIFSRLSHSLLPFSLFIFFFYLVHQHLAASFLPSSGRLIFPFCA